MSTRLPAPSPSQHLTVPSSSQQWGRGEAGLCLGNQPNTTSSFHLCCPIAPPLPFFLKNKTKQKKQYAELIKPEITNKAVLWFSAFVYHHYYLKNIWVWHVWGGFLWFLVFSGFFCVCRIEILDSIGCLNGSCRKEMRIIRKWLTVTLLFTKLFPNKWAQKELKEKKMHEITFFARKVGCVRSWMHQQKS